MGRRDPDSLDHYDLPNDGGSFAIAGYQFLGGQWKDVENGDWPLERHGLDRIADVLMVTIHYTNPDTGDDQYRTIHGPFPDEFEWFIEYVEYIMDPYTD